MARQWGAAGQWGPAGAGRGAGAPRGPISAFRPRGGACPAHPLAGRGVRGVETSCYLALGSRPGEAGWFWRPPTPRPPVCPSQAGDWAETRSRTAPLPPRPGWLDAAPPEAVPRGPGRAERGPGETAGEDARRPRGDDGWKRVASEPGSRGRGEAAGGRAPTSMDGEQLRRPGSDPGGEASGTGCAAAPRPPRTLRQGPGSGAAQPPPAADPGGPLRTTLAGPQPATSSSPRGPGQLRAGTRRSGFEPKAVGVGAGLARVPAADSALQPPVGLRSGDSTGQAGGHLVEGRPRRAAAWRVGRWSRSAVQGRGSCADPIDGREKCTIFSVLS